MVHFLRVSSKFIKLNSHSQFPSRFRLEDQAATSALARCRTAPRCHADFSAAPMQTFREPFQNLCCSNAEARFQTALRFRVLACVRLPGVRAPCASQNIKILEFLATKYFSDKTFGEADVRKQALDLSGKKFNLLDVLVSSLKSQVADLGLSLLNRASFTTPPALVKLLKSS